MTTKSRSELRRYFVKNAIPTEGNFAELIDAPLNQADDGVFRQGSAEPLSVVAATGDQKRVLQLYNTAAAPRADWLFSLNPKGTEAPNALTPGFGIVDGGGTTRLLLDARDGRLSVGGNVAYGGQLSKLDVADNPTAQVRAAELFIGHSSRRGTPGRALVDARTDLVVNMARDWPQVVIDSPLVVRGPLTAAAGASVNGGLAVAGGATITGPFTVNGNAQALRIYGGDHAYMEWYPQGSAVPRKGWMGYYPAGTNSFTINSEGGDLNLLTTGAVKVTGGALVPVAGNTPASGIQFPPNVAGGSGDTAWIRYYPRSGEDFTLEIGIANDAGDHIALMPSGAVGIGTLAPTPNSRLHVVGGSLAISPEQAMLHADAVIHAVGSGGRLFQMSQRGVSMDALNILAAAGPSGTVTAPQELWWAWGVTTQNVWRIRPGTVLDGADGLSIRPDGKVGIGKTPERTLDVNGIIRAAGEVQVEGATAGTGVLKIGAWTLEASSERLLIKAGSKIVAAFIDVPASAMGLPMERFAVYTKQDGARPYFYVSGMGSAGSGLA